MGIGFGSKNRDMTPRLLVPSLILIGIVFIAIGSQWNRLRPAEAYWSAEQAAEYTKAHAEMHSLAHNHGNGHDETQSQEFAAAKDRFNKINEQLERARSSRIRTGTILTAIGLVSLLSGVALHFANRPSV